MERSSAAFDYGELAQYAEAKFSGNAAQVDSWLRTAVERCLAEVSAVAGRKFDLEIIPPGSADSEQVWSETPQTVCVGTASLRHLDDSCLGFAGYLLTNFVTQNMGVGPSVPLPVLKPAREFPEAALQLYAANMLPRATDPAGKLRSDFESLMASFPPSGDSVSLSDLVQSQGRMAKSPLPQDWRDGLSSAKSLLEGDPLPHLVLLYGRLLYDAVLLLLAHESSHILLGHFDETTPTANRSREDEVAADTNAIRLLTGKTAFNLRSAILLFGFFADTDQVKALDNLGHPFAADRLSILADGARAVAGEGLEEDLNTGLQLLRKPLRIEAQEGLLPPGSTLKAWAASDLYFSATAVLEIRINGKDEWERSGLGEGWEMELGLVIRSRVHPATILRTGSAIRSLETSGHQSIDAEGVTYFWTVTLDAPPSWWLDLPQETLAIENARLRAGNSPARWQCPEALTPPRLLESFHELGARNPQAATRAAHRAMKWEPPDIALRMLLGARENCGDRDADALQWIVEHLLSAGDVDDTAKLLEDFVRTAPYVPPGFRNLLAAARWRQFRRLAPGRAPLFGLRGEALRLYESSLDLSLRETNCSFETPEQKAAKELIAEILKFSRRTTAAKALITGTREYASGINLIQQDPKAAAAHLARSAQIALSAASQASIDAVYFRQTAGEAALAEAVCGSRDFTQAKDCFRRVLKSDSSFVPALVGLAKCGLEEADYASTGKALADADRIAPNHRFLEDIRQEYSRRLDALWEPRADAAALAIQAGQPEKVLALADEMLRIDPAFPNAFSARALANYYFSRLDEARSDCETYLGTQGDTFHETVLLGQILVEMGLFGQASEYLAMVMGCARHLPKADEMTEDNALPYSEPRDRARAKGARALSDYHLGAGDRAVKAAAEAAAEYPACGPLLLHCAEVMRLAGKLEQARSLVASALTASEWPLTAAQASCAGGFLGANNQPLLNQTGKNASAI